MNKELENKLADAFPFMRIEEQEVGGRINNPYSAFGCECSDGWYELLYGLCSEITEAYQRYNQPVDIEIDQVKEKYGTLRFYYHHKKAEENSGSVDYPGGVIRFIPIVNVLHQETADIVEKWEGKSETVCENCGKPGTLREDLSWIRTLCDDCCKKAT